MPAPLKLTPDSETPRPSDTELAAAAARLGAGPAADAKVLGDGWSFYVYHAGDHVLRFPKAPEYVARADSESRLTHALVSVLPVPISAIDLHMDGPNGMPFTSHRYLPGEPCGAHLPPNAVEPLGRFLRALHDFSVESAVALGLDKQGSENIRGRWARFYERVIREAFPLVSCEARGYIEETFESFLNDDANFDFQPVVSHNDINGRNLLVDPGTGELTGVIDFTNTGINDPAFDFSDLLQGELLNNGRPGQVEALERGYDRPLEPFRARCRFYASCWPLYRILEGITLHDRDFIEDGIRLLNAQVPSGARCD